MNYCDLNDLQLLQLLQEENEDAFSAIYKRYGKPIYIMALTYTKSPEAAQDIVQDIFVKVTERAYEFLCEGKRWHDLKRTGTLTETIKAAKGIDVAVTHLLFPIPKQEIDNKPDIAPADQNPGY